MAALQKVVLPSHLRTKPLQWQLKSLWLFVMANPDSCAAAAGVQRQCARVGESGHSSIITPCLLLFMDTWYSPSEVGGHGVLVKDNADLQNKFLEIRIALMVLTSFHEHLIEYSCNVEE